MIYIQKFSHVLTDRATAAYFSARMRTRQIWKRVLKDPRGLSGNSKSDESPIATLIFWGYKYPMAPGLPSAL